MTATKPARIARVARVAETLFADWIKVNTYGSDDDGSYEVMADSPTSVRWTRIGEPTRTYRVWVASGVAVGCDCRGSKRWDRCCHRTLTTGLIARGKFTMPTDAVSDATVYADVPSGWLGQTEWD